MMFIDPAHCLVSLDLCNVLSPKDVALARIELLNVSQALCYSYAFTVVISRLYDFYDIQDRVYVLSSRAVQLYRTFGALFVIGSCSLD